MKRIIMMLALAALLVVALSMSAVSAFADIENYCQNHPEDTNKCPVTVTGPGQSETTPAQDKNPNVKKEQHRVVPTP